MSDAPERIWIDALGVPETRLHAGTYYLEDDDAHETVEYIRADVYDRAIKTARLFAKCDDKGTRQKMREELEGVLDA